MNTKRLILLGMILFATQMRAQWVHVHINNNDKSARLKHAAMVAATVITDGMVGAMRNDIRGTEKEMKKLLNQYYKSNSFDKKHENDYMKKATITAVHGIITDAAKKIPKLPYMTQNKKEYLNELNADKIAPILVLKEMSLASEELAKADNRQEIYRLRSEILTLLSKDDQEVRRNLLLPFGAYSYKNRNTILQLIRKLNNPMVIK